MYEAASSYNYKQGYSKQTNKQSNYITYNILKSTR